MAFQKMWDGSWHAANSIQKMWDGSWHGVNTVQKMWDGHWYTVWNSYTAIHSAHCSPGAVSHNVESGAGMRYTDGTAAYWAGGTGNVSFRWERHSGDGSISASSPNSQVTNFNTYFNNVTASKTAIFRCTISDGISSAVAFVNVSLYNNANNGGGGGPVIEL